MQCGGNGFNQPIWGVDRTQLRFAKRGGGDPDGRGRLNKAERGGSRNDFDLDVLVRKYLLFKENGYTTWLNRTSYFCGNYWEFFAGMAVDITICRSRSLRRNTRLEGGNRIFPTVFNLIK